MLNTSALNAAAAKTFANRVNPIPALDDDDDGSSSDES